jgi:hypothetical protein
VGKHSIKEYMRKLAAFFLITVVLNVGCIKAITKTDKYEEIPSMLNILTNKVQSAVEDGYFANGEQVLLAYVSEKYPNVYNWFEDRSYELRIDVVDGYAVVMVCDEGMPVFEDTYCNAGFPDKDHRGTSDFKSCEITMTIEEVKNICE